jgi:hypothetical protein
MRSRRSGTREATSLSPAELADQPLQAARLRLTLGDVYRSLDLLDAAPDHLEKAAAALDGSDPANASGSAGTGAR